jgi:replicative DNA helicase
MIESEKIVLGGLILNNEKMYEVLPILSPDSFKNLNHSRLYRHLMQFHYDNEPFDLISIGDRLGNQWINPVGKLVQQYISHGNILNHTKLIKENHQREQLKKVLSESLGKLAKREKPQPVINDITTFLASMECTTGTQLRNIGDNMDKFSEDMAKRRESKDKILGLTTGLIDLDQAIQGLQDESFIVIAGRPSMGKSCLAENIGTHNAIENNKTVLFFTIEMPEYQIQQRMVSSLANVDYGQIQTGECLGEDNLLPKISDSITKIKKGKFIIDDSSSLSISDMKSKSISYARKSGGVDLIIVDYLQLLSAKAESRFQEISTISRELKGLAKTLKCPVLALSQLNRNLESRQDKRPVMADLRESGQIEQDADVVAFIYRDEVYDEYSQAQGLAEIIIAKARNCPKKNIVTIFNGAKQTFRNASPQAYNIINNLKSNINVDQASTFQKRYSKN